jgi:hypothetical protein
MKNQNKKDIENDLVKIDDIEKEYPQMELLSFLGFSPAISKMLCRSYWSEKHTVTIQEIFEVVISDEIDHRPGYLISKMLDVPMIGAKTFLFIVDHINKRRLGPETKKAWRKKYIKYLQAHRVKGGRIHSWSSPITEEGKNLAKFRKGSPYIPRKRKR